MLFLRDTEREKGGENADEGETRGWSNKAHPFSVLTFNLVFHEKNVHGITVPSCFIWAKLSPSARENAFWIYIPLYKHHRDATKRSTHFWEDKVVWIKNTEIKCDKANMLSHLILLQKTVISFVSFVLIDLHLMIVMSVGRDGIQHTIKQMHSVMISVTFI